jgi:hypothetical protein
MIIRRIPNERDRGGVRAVGATAAICFAHVTDRRHGFVAAARTRRAPRETGAGQALPRTPRGIPGAGYLSGNSAASSSRFGGGVSSETTINEPIEMIAAG